MKHPTLPLLYATLLSPLLGLAQDVAAVPQVSSTLTTTLEELGYPSGITFDDTSVPNEQTLLFYLPMEMQVKSAELHIVYTGSAQIRRGASLNVTINDRSRLNRTLTADSITHEWVLPVPRSALARGQIKITLQGDIPVNYQQIVDGQPQSGHVRISPSSRLVTRLEGGAISLRDAWLTLPDEVVISIPGGPVDEATFKAALDWITLLRRNHRTVRITTLPDIGNLVIAPEADITMAIAEVSGSDTSIRMLWNETGPNVGTVNQNGISFIAAIPPYADVPRFGSIWRALSHPTRIDPQPAKVDNAIPDKVMLSVLGLSTATAMLGHRLQWSATITPWNMPPGMHADSARLHLVMPQTDSEKIFRIFIYLNDMLIKSERFVGDGREQEILAPFDSVPHSDIYQLRIVIRDEGRQDNTEPTKRYPVRITAQSHVTVSRELHKPAGLSSVPTALGQGFVLYVPSEYLSSAPRYLPLLGQLLTGFMVPKTDYDLIVLDSGHVPKPQGNFIVAGDIPLGEASLPVRFDQGRVQVVNYRGEVLISERSLSQDSVIQLMNHGGITGLWFHPGETGSMPAIDVNRLGNDDVAIYEADSLAISIDSKQEDLARMQYLEAPRWYERLYNQRYIWTFAAWVLLTLGIVYLNDKSKRHLNG